MGFLSNPIVSWESPGWHSMLKGNSAKSRVIRRYVVAPSERWEIHRPPLKQLVVVSLDLPSMISSPWWRIMIEFIYVFVYFLNYLQYLFICLLFFFLVYLFVHLFVFTTFPYTMRGDNMINRHVPTVKSSTHAHTHTYANIHVKR